MISSGVMCCQLPLIPAMSASGALTAMGNLSGKAVGSLKSRSCKSSIARELKGTPANGVKKLFCQKKFPAISDVPAAFRSAATVTGSKTSL